MTRFDDGAPPFPTPRPRPPRASERDDLRAWLGALTADVDGSGAVVFTPDPEGMLRPAVWVGYSDDLVHTWLRLGLDGTPAADAFAADRPVVLADARTDTDYPKLGVSPGGPGRALLAVPVPGPDGAPCAVLGVSFGAAEDLLAAGVRWDALARDLADRLDAVPAGAAGQASHLRTPPAGTGSDGVVLLATRLLAAASPEDVLDEVARAALPALGAGWVAISLLEPDGETLRLVSLRNVSEDVTSAYGTYPLDAPLPAREALRERRPVLMHDLAERDALYPALAGIDVAEHAFATLPLQTATEDLGVLTFGWLTEQAFDRRQLRTLEAVATWCTAALQRARAQSVVRSTAETLQRALLPRLADVAGWQVAAHYAPATEGTQVGGDWYDVFALPGGLVGLALGDVMGKGTAAAAVMGSVRSALRAYASIDPSPDVVLARLDAFVAGTAEDQLVTCAYLVLDPVTGVVRHAAAGHPPALVASPTHARWLDDALVPPLNSGAGPQPAIVGTDRLRAGEALVLYSDGLVERRGQDPDEAHADLMAAASALLAAPDLEQACRGLVEALAHPARNVDDLAVLALRRQPFGEPERSASAAS